MGRFTQPDPSGQEKNPYLYAEGDPVNRIYPTGLLSFDDASDLASTAFSLAGGCASGVQAAAHSGVMTMASAFGPTASVGVGVFSCALGAGVSYAGGELVYWRRQLTAMLPVHLGALRSLPRLYPSLKGSMKGWSMSPAARLTGISIFAGLIGCCFLVYGIVFDATNWVIPVVVGVAAMIGAAMTVFGVWSNRA
ncbi:hypothetical protein [Streptomyces bohaiensis]|uniref:hypothetical protein n=1 Tax=Streptomyces bohaiensis TaxID=1431344 RepID=UPI0035E44A4F